MRRGADRGRQRGGEDETRRIGAYRIDHVHTGCDVAAEAAERLGERTLDHVDASHCVVAVADAAAARAIHADRMHFVAISHRVVALGKVADRVHVRDITVH